MRWPFLISRLAKLLLLCLLGVTVVIDAGLAARAWKECATSVRAGFTARSLDDEADEEAKYIVFVPVACESRARPSLLLFMNGYGENGRDGARQISNNFGEPLWEVQRYFPLICVAPQCRNRWASDSDDFNRALAILEHLIKQYNVDPDRVYITGVSAGGAGVWNMAAAYPERFAAIVPMSTVGRAPEAEVIKHVADHNLAVWDVFNDADPAAGLVDNHQTTRERLFVAGLSPVFATYEQDHHDCWNAGYRNAAMFEWLSRQSRSENARRAAGTRFRELLVDESGLSQWTSRGSGLWTVAERILVCRGASARPASELALNAELADFELHFDYRSASDTGCEIVLESVESGDDTVWIRFESPAHGTGGVRHVPSGEWLGNVNPVAQVEWLPGRWNDLRISLRDGELQLLLNGAELLVVRDQRLIGTHRVKLCVPAGEVNDREWRYLRLWDPNGAKTIAKKKTGKT